MWCKGGGDREEVVARFGEIGDWNVGAVMSMRGLFSNPGRKRKGIKDFNEDISRWDTSSVTDMHKMFSGACSFNQPVEGWNTANVTDMMGMFTSASSFNQPVEGWNTANVWNMLSMFHNASSFTQQPSWYR